ncbi:hypothetical protein GCM10009689_13660 [Brevibacterium antiquum]|uniref:choice-of-anchor I domain-containing protein n=1 Tax=Brevibacterium antiquum TaxID=234835 RepID=UPI002FCCE68C
MRWGETAYAFVGFERVGGIAAFDLSDPANPQFVTYFNNRDFSVSVEDEIEDASDPEALLSKAGDLGPEGIAFLGADESPTGEAALVVGNEVSGTTSLYSVADLNDDGAGADSDDFADAGASADSDASVDSDGAAEDATADPDGKESDAAATTADSDTGDEANSDAGDAANSGSKGDAGSSDGTDAADDNAGSLPRTGADLGQYLILGGIALALIGFGVLAVFLTRRRGQRRRGERTGSAGSIAEDLGSASWD